MTHPRTCPLLIGMLSTLREEVTRPENDDLEEQVEELAERVAEAHSPEADTHIRCFNLVDALLTKVMPCADYLKTRPGTRQTLNELEEAAKRQESMYVPEHFTIEGLNNVLARVTALLDKKELDHISMELRGEDLTGFNDDKLKAFGKVANACNKAAVTLQKSLRGTTVSWHATGRAGCEVLCVSFPMESTISLVETLLNTGKENARISWNP